MIKVKGSSVAVVPVENPEMIGSIIIPDIAKERLNQGFVKYKGPRVKDLKIGDYIIFSGWTGTLIDIEDEGKLIILPEKFCTAVIEHQKGGKTIPGAYFRDRLNDFDNQMELTVSLKQVLPDLEHEVALDLATKLHKVGVISMRSIPFYPATYEHLMSYVAQAFSEDREWRDAIKVVDHHPILSSMSEEKRMELVTATEDDDDEE